MRDPASKNKKMGSNVIVTFPCQLDTLEEGMSVEELPPSDWPINVCGVSIDRGGPSPQSLDKLVCCVKKVAEIKSGSQATGNAPPLVFILVSEKKNSVEPLPHVHRKLHPHISCTIIYFTEQRLAGMLLLSLRLPG